MLEVATLTASTTRPKRRYTGIRPARLARIYKLKARGLTHEEIAHREGIAECTVSRVLKKPTSPTQFTDLSRRLDLSKYDKQAARERVKDYLAARLITTLDKAFDLAEQTLRNGDARGFAHAMTGSRSSTGSRATPWEKVGTSFLRVCRRGRLRTFRT